MTKRASVAMRPTVAGSYENSGAPRCLAENSHAKSCTAQPGLRNALVRESTQTRWTSCPTGNVCRTIRSELCASWLDKARNQPVKAQQLTQALDLSRIQRPPQMQGLRARCAQLTGASLATSWTYGHITPKGKVPTQSTAVRSHSHTECSVSSAGQTA